MNQITKNFNPFAFWEFATRHGIDSMNLPENLGFVPMRHIEGPKVVIEQADLNYEGSVTVPQAWIDKGWVRPGQLVFIVPENPKCDSSGLPLSLSDQIVATYVIPPKPDEDPTKIRLNGGAANIFSLGDRVKFFCPAYTDDQDLIRWVNNNLSASDSIHSIRVNRNNELEEIDLRTDPTLSRIYDPKKIIEPHLKSKIHRIILLPVPNELKEIAEELDQRRKPTLLICPELAKAAGFEEGRNLDALPIYGAIGKTDRRSVVIKLLEEGQAPLGHASLCGCDLAMVLEKLHQDYIKNPLQYPSHPNTTVLICYEPLREPEAIERSNRIINEGYPWVVICDDKATAENCLEEEPTEPINRLKLLLCSSRVQEFFADRQSLYNPIFHSAKNSYCQ